MKNQDICKKKIKPNFDYIIVGQGLAGSCLALQLLERGKKVLVFDKAHKNRASAVAAGLFNPVTGKLLTRAWKADVIFPYLFQFYKEAEIKLGQRFFYPKALYRPFISVAEQNEWMARSESRELKNYVEKISTSSLFGNQTYDDFGGILINHSGHLDTNQFMQSVNRWLKNENSFQDLHFDSRLLKIFPDKVSYLDFEASNIIFCEGFNSQINVFFNWVPIIPLKGETLDISLEEKPEVIYNRGVYIVPDQKNGYKVGATYKPSEKSEGVTVEAKEELVEKLTEFIKIPFKINDQNWGIRPSTRDRHPVLGSHPAHKNLFIFNGLGTKGVSLAPYYSQLMSAWLDGQVEIAKEANIERFKSLYSKFSAI